MTHETRGDAGAIRPNSRWEKRKAESERRIALADGSTRRGSVLVVVLVVLVVLTLGAYTFSEYMLIEAQATVAFGHDAQARAAADSGLEYAASVLTQRTTLSPQMFYDNPAWFQGVVVRGSANPREAARFSVIMANENDPSGQGIRYGLLDESSKLNINILPKLITNQTAAQTALLALPEMTPDIADAILDFVDSDTTVRAYGAEDETYASLGYKAKNGPLDSIDELLLVRGVTPWLLFGEDANRNGVLDPNENDGEVNPPTDNGDGILNRGWSMFLTVHGRESNLMSDGTARINVNQSSMQDLYEQILPVLGDEMALFVMAYRAKAPATTGGGNATGGGATASAGGTGGGTGGGSTGGSSGGGGGTNTASNSNSGSSSGGGSSSGSKSSSSNSTTVSGTKSASTASTLNSNVATTGTAKTASTQLSTASTAKSAGTAQQGGSGTSKAGSSSGAQQGAATTQKAGTASTAQTIGGTGAQAPIIVAGIDVTAGGQTTINSLYDLLDQTVTVAINGVDTTLVSPWSSDPGSVQSKLPEMFDALTVSTSEFIDGRVNVNQARPEVLTAILAAVPSLPTSIVDAIVSGQSGSGSTEDRSTTGWLLSTGAIDLPTMRQLDKYLTSRGDVFRVQSVGYFEKGGTTARIEAVIDATKNPPAVVFQRDLTDMGRGFSAQLLQTGSLPAQ